jgi:hypothetical protein
MKILFTGGDGHLNSKFKDIGDSEFIFLNKPELVKNTTFNTSKLESLLRKL